MTFFDLIGIEFELLIAQYKEVLCEYSHNYNSLASDT